MGVATTMAQRQTLFFFFSSHGRRGPAEAALGANYLIFAVCGV